MRRASVAVSPLAPFRPVVVVEHIGTRTGQRYPPGSERILRFLGYSKNDSSVIASEAKQSIARQKQAWIASSRSLLAMTVGTLCAQHVLLHFAAVEMEERHRRVVVQGAGGKA